MWIPTRVAHFLTTCNDDDNDGDGGDGVGDNGDGGDGGDGDDGVVMMVMVVVSMTMMMNLFPSDIQCCVWGNAANQNLNDNINER